MRNTILVVFFALLVQDTFGQTNPTPLEEGVREHFRVERIIQLPRELIVGDIISIDVASKGVRHSRLRSKRK